MTFVTLLAIYIIFRRLRILQRWMTAKTMRQLVAALGASPVAASMRTMGRVLFIVCGYSLKHTVHRCKLKKKFGYRFHPSAMEHYLNGPGGEEALLIADSKCGEGVTDTDPALFRNTFGMTLERAFVPEPDEMVVNKRAFKASHDTLINGWFV